MTARPRTMDRPLSSVERRRRHVSRIGVPAGAALIAIVVFVGFFYRSQRLVVASSDVTSAKVTETLFVDGVTSIAVVETLKNSYLTSSTGGQVAQVFKRPGEEVKEREPILRLRNPQLELNYIARRTEVTQQIANLQTLMLQYEQQNMFYSTSLIQAEKQLPRRAGRL